MDLDNSFSTTSNPTQLKESRSSIKQINARRDQKNSSSNDSLDKRITIIQDLCSQAQREGKKTLPLKMIKEVIDKGDLKLPKKLPDDAVEVKEVIKHIQGGKSKSCVIM